MVNYDIITVGLEVDFLLDNKVHSGIVRYKGSVNGYEGVWIGIEAKEPVGDFDGRIMGRTYFKCSDKHGLFLTADQIRLKTFQKKKRRSYLCKSVNSECDDLLFKKQIPNDKIVCITSQYLNRAKSAFEFDYSDPFAPAPRHITHETLVFQPKKKAEPKSTSTSTEQKSFQPVSSISKTFMPVEEMKLYTKLNWSYKNVKIPGTSSVNNSFDGFNKNRSNYMPPNKT